MIFWIRSIIFDVLFYVANIISCVAFIPFLFTSRQVLMKAVRIYLQIIYWLERNILGLDYEIRGQEHLPKQGSYIIAAKHQSAYETLKLLLLFNDPAIVLKQELLQIPLWGRFLQKVDSIAINRKNRDTAIASIVEGALRIKAQQRPIVIFPQGTRVKVEIPSSQKRYKSGIFSMYEAADLPIIPMALNSGLFWPRKGFLKYSGTVIFEFLPAIAPGQSKANLMRDLENTLESASIKLMQEAQDTYPYLKHIQIAENTDEKA